MNFKALTFLLVMSSVTSFAKETIKPKTIIFKVAHGPVEVINVPLQEFKKEVEAKSNGSIKVIVDIPKTLKHTNYENIKKTYADLKSGKVQMSQLYTFLLTEFDKNFHALDLPFIFKDHQHSFAAVDGEPGKELLRNLEQKSNLLGFGFTYSGGHRAIVTNGLKLEKMEDFKNLKLNLPAPASAVLFSELGAVIEENIAKEKIARHIKKGEVSAYETVLPRYLHSGDYKLVNTLNVTNHNIQFTVVLINQDFFNTLSPEEQKIVREAAEKSVIHERNLTLKVADEVNNNAQRHKINLVKMNDAEVLKLKKFSAEIDWVSRLGITKDFVQKLQDAK